jgi:hypothetical protein
MRAPRGRIWRWRACTRGLRLGGAAALAIMLGGCAAERPVPVDGETPAAAAQTSAARSAGAFQVPVTTIATAAPLHVKTKLPPAVVMPGGGTRIDMRGSGKHTRALERQPDGTFKHVCVDVPEIGRSSR